MQYIKCCWQHGVVDSLSSLPKVCSSGVKSLSAVFHIYVARFCVGLLQLGMGGLEFCI